MMTDDELPRPKSPSLTPRDLAPLGIEELRTYVGELSTEIVRAESEILRKQQQRDAASLFFKANNNAG